MLRYLKETKKLGWKEIALHFPNRTTNACQFRWRRLVFGNVRSVSTSSATPVSTSCNQNSVGSSTQHHFDPPPEASVNPYLKQQQVPAPGFVDPLYQPTYIPPYSKPWSREEDKVILARSDLRLDELSLILVGRNEMEIMNRKTELLSRYPHPVPTSAPLKKTHSSSDSKSQHHSSASALPPLREYTSMNQLPSISTISNQTSSAFNNNVLPPLKTLKKSKSTFDGLRLPPPPHSHVQPSSSFQPSSTMPSHYGSFTPAAHNAGNMSSHYSNSNYQNYGSNGYR